MFQTVDSLEILVLIKLAQRPPLYPYGADSSGARCQYFGPSLPLLPYFDVGLIPYAPVAMVMSGRSIHPSTLFSWASLTMTSCTYFRL